MVYAFIQDVPIDEERYRRVIDNLGPEVHRLDVLHATGTLLDPASS